MRWRLPLLTSLLLLAGACAPAHHTMGLGGGAVVVPSTGASQPRPTSSPTLVLESGRSMHNGRVLGFVSRSSLSLHDWRTVGAIWRWYGAGPPPGSDRDLLLPWYVGLFPVTVLAPLAASDLALQPGLSVRPGEPTGQRLPFVEAGPSLSLWMRPSMPSLAADLTGGVWLGVGLPLSPGVDLGARFTLAQPAVHTALGQVRAPIAHTVLMLRTRPATARRHDSAP